MTSTPWPAPNNIYKDILRPSVIQSQISERALGVLSFLTWAYFCLPCAMTDIAIGCLSFPNLIVLSSSTFSGSPYGPDSLPPTLAPQPMRLLRRSSISISQGLKKFQGLQNLTARLRHQDTLFFRLFWGKSLKIWYLQKKFSPSAYSWWCFFSFKTIIHHFDYAEWVRLTDFTSVDGLNENNLIIWGWVWALL